MPEQTRMEIVTPRLAGHPKEIKVRLSQEMCVRLHSRKILDGVTIAETVAEALESYFAQLQARAAEQGKTLGDLADYAP